MKISLMKRMSNHILTLLNHRNENFSKVISLLSKSATLFRLKHSISYLLCSFFHINAHARLMSLTILAYQWKWFLSIFKNAASKDWHFRFLSSGLVKKRQHVIHFFIKIWLFSISGVRHGKTLEVFVTHSVTNGLGFSIFRFFLHPLKPIIVTVGLTDTTEPAGRHW